MSIYASLAAPDADEHTDECASWNKDAGMWSLSERPCDCGQPDAPSSTTDRTIFPGSGAVTEAWERWRRQLRLEVSA